MSRNPSTASLHILVSWPEQESYSIISARKIVPSHDQLEVGAVCDVKNYEHCLTKVLAMGTEQEMDHKLLEIIDQDKSAVPTLELVEKENSCNPSKASTNKSKVPPLEMVKKENSCSNDNQCAETGQELPHSPLFLPEPDIQWYVHPITPHTTKTKRIHPSHKKTEINRAPELREDRGEVQMKMLMTMIKDLKMNMDKMLEKMERLESAVSKCSCRDLPPPLPPRNTPKQQTLTANQPISATHQASSAIPPGYLIPLKLTDF